MAKCIMICGRICSGKSTYAMSLWKENDAIILSIDELMLSLFGKDVGEQHDAYVAKTEKYLLEKSLQIIEVGVNVIFDWGFWTKEKEILSGISIVHTVLIVDSIISISAMRNGKNVSKSEMLKSKQGSPTLIMWTMGLPRNAIPFLKNRNGTKLTFGCKFNILIFPPMRS